MKSAVFTLLAFCSLVIALPVLSTLGEGATFFVAHGALPTDILLFMFSIYLLPPVLLLSVALGIKWLFGAATANGFVYAALGLLAVLWAVSHLARVPTVSAIAIAIVFAAVIVRAYAKSPQARSFFQIIGQASPLILVYVLAFTPVSQLLLAENVEAENVAGAADIPIVMLVFDELSLAGIVTPAGEIDAGRLPNFARLEQMSTWYRNATTVSTATQKAIPAILSGLMPNDETLPTYNQFPRNLFTLLAGSHEIHAIEAVSKLCPRRICSEGGEAEQAGFSPAALYRDAGYVWLHTVLPPALGHRYLPSVSGGWRDFGNKKESGVKQAPNARLGRLIKALIDHPANLNLAGLDNFNEQRFNQFLANIHDSKASSVNYLHLTLPHHPWVHFPDGSLYNGKKPPGLKSALTWADNQSLVDQGVLQHALQLEFVDGLLGRMLDFLEESGRLHDTLLIVLADHGLAMAPGKPMRKPVVSTLAALARIPLFIKYPGQNRPAQKLRKAQSIDVLPTIAEVVGLQLPQAVDGQSLISENWKVPERRVDEAGDAVPDFEAALEMRGAIARYSRVLEPGRSAMDAFGSDHSRVLMGTSPSPAVPEDSALILEIHNLESYKNVDLQSGTLPARLDGSARGVNSGTEILIALNNIFAGSGTIYDEEGSVSVMLDPRHFREGSNDLKAYRLVAGELHALPITVE